MFFRLDDILPALWAPGQPDGPKNRRVRVSEIEFCIAVRQVEGLSEMDPPGLLHDEPCHRLAAAVCEEKPSSMKLGFMGKKNFVFFLDNLQYNELSIFFPDPETEERTEEMEEQEQLRREGEPMSLESMGKINFVFLDNLQYMNFQYFPQIQKLNKRLMKWRNKYN